MDNVVDHFYLLIVYSSFIHSVVQSFSRQSIRSKGNGHSSLTSVFMLTHERTNGTMDSAIVPMASDRRSNNIYRGLCHGTEIVEATV